MGRARSGGLFQGLKSMPFTVAADKKRLTASILSGPLEIPRKDALASARRRWMRVCAPAAAVPATDVGLEQAHSDPVA